MEDDQQHDDDKIEVDVGLSKRDNQTVPAFLLKTYEIISLNQFQQFVRWSGDGDSIQILDVPAFSDKVLPLYFKHNNFQSFVRQLNMYSFSKTRHDANWREFRHPYFKRERPDLLVLIKRKTNTSTQAYVAKSQGGALAVAALSDAVSSGLDGARSVEAALDDSYYSDSFGSGGGSSSSSSSMYAPRDYSRAQPLPLQHMLPSFVHQQLAGPPRVLMGSSAAFTGAQAVYGAVADAGSSSSSFNGGAASAASSSAAPAGSTNAAPRSMLSIPGAASSSLSSFPLGSPFSTFPPSMSSALMEGLSAAHPLSSPSVNGAPSMSIPAAWKTIPWPLLALSQSVSSSSSSSSSASPVYIFPPTSSSAAGGAIAASTVNGSAPVAASLAVQSVPALAAAAPSENRAGEPPVASNNGAGQLHARMSFALNGPATAATPIPIQNGVSTTFTSDAVGAVLSSALAPASGSADSSSGAAVMAPTYPSGGAAAAAHAMPLFSTISGISSSNTATSAPPLGQSSSVSTIPLTSPPVGPGALGHGLFSPPSAMGVAPDAPSAAAAPSAGPTTSTYAAAGPALTTTTFPLPTGAKFMLKAGPVGSGGGPGPFSFASISKMRAGGSPASAVGGAPAHSFAVSGSSAGGSSSGAGAVYGGAPINNVNVGTLFAVDGNIRMLAREIDTLKARVKGLEDHLARAEMHMIRVRTENDALYGMFEAADPAFLQSVRDHVRAALVKPPKRPSVRTQQRPQQPLDAAGVTMNGTTHEEEDDAAAAAASSSYSSSYAEAASAAAGTTAFRSPRSYQTYHPRGRGRGRGAKAAVAAAVVARASSPSAAPSSSSRRSAGRRATAGVSTRYDDDNGNNDGVALQVGESGVSPSSAGRGGQGGGREGKRRSRGRPAGSQAAVRAAEDWYDNQPAWTRDFEHFSGGAPAAYGEYDDGEYDDEYGSSAAASYGGGDEDEDRDRPLYRHTRMRMSADNTSHGLGEGEGRASGGADDAVLQALLAAITSDDSTGGTKQQQQQRRRGGDGDHTLVAQSSTEALSSSSSSELHAETDFSADVAASAALTSEIARAEGAVSDADMTTAPQSSDGGVGTTTPSSGADF